MNRLWTVGDCVTLRKDMLKNRWVMVEARRRLIKVKTWWTMAEVRWRLIKIETWWVIVEARRRIIMVETMWVMMGEVRINRNKNLKRLCWW